jgi:hypothetical protein
MRAEVTMRIDKSWVQVLPRRHLSRTSGRKHSRIGQGAHPCKGAIMVRVTNHPESFNLQWRCKLCGEKCTLDQLWLAFAPRETAIAEWVHKQCVSGQVESAFGSKRVVLMNGHEALRRLAASLQDSRDPALARQRPRGTVKAKALWR